MLSLEQRYLETIIPCVKGLDIVDIGCGTGRWLEKFRVAEPRTLLGVDSSPEMLSCAKRKLRRNAQFLLGDGASVPLAPASADLILGNFVLSYINDVAAFLTNVCGALRPNGRVFLTDVHPTTSAALHWRRGVQTETGLQKIRIFERSIESVIALCEAQQFRLSVRLEPCFGSAEKPIFESSGKMASFEQSAGSPAIYILQFRRVTATDRPVRRQGEETISIVRNALLCLGPEETTAAPLCLSNTQIATVGETAATKAAVHVGAEIDLQGFLAFPGLVNAHDHLEFALFPRLGRGHYRNSLEWAEDIHRSEPEIIARHRQVPKTVRLWWGGIRNLLSGVTTVSHHNPYDSKVFKNKFVVRVVREYGWAHSLSLDSEVAAKKRATPVDQPFLLHLAEGIDEDSQLELRALHRAGALDKNTIIIHGLALSEKDHELLRTSGGGLIWCPSSNVFLFGSTLPSGGLQSLSELALGSDSPLTAEGDLLDEVRFAYRATNLPPTKLFRCITRDAARILRLQQGQGSFQVDGVADLFAVRDRGQSPAETLAELSYRDVELVLVGGRVHLASDQIVRRLPHHARKGLQPLLIEETLRWIRVPLDWLFRETEPYLPEGIFLSGKRVRLGVGC
jgi:cytosine/adenosine deaminase-related metal-dependent hydrolase/SAM-dependent methyltransferase